jgi:two-component system alkaline phosphatase synthesis response regulator PhoP
VARRSKTEEPVGPTRVLVVDDNQDACELIARVVESAGWTATRCYSQDDALDKLDNGDPPFKAVIADFQSGGTGASLELLDSVRRSKDFKDVPVLLVTHNETNRMYAWESGADAFLVRPFHADDLINEVYAVLTRSTDERDAWRETQLADN